jgi:hypothetical protein
MSRANQPTTVYALRDSATGKYINADGDKPVLKPLAEATRFPATPQGLSELVQTAVDKLHPHGVRGYEIDRIEPARPFPGG